MSLYIWVGQFFRTIFHGVRLYHQYSGLEKSCLKFFPGQYRMTWTIFRQDYIVIKILNNQKLSENYSENLCKSIDKGDMDKICDELIKNKN